MNTPQKLTTILKASGWSQEQLAHSLGVSFATLNSWVNRRSTPRAKALVRIEKLYLNVVGAEEVDEDVLQQTKIIALGLRQNIKDIIADKQVLNTLTLHLTYHTNTIEGSTMTLSDVEEVIFDNKVLSNRTAIEQAEARNHQATLHWLIEQIDSKGKKFEIDEPLILAIHLRLMNGIISDAGKYRNHSVRIMGSRVSLANYLKIPKLISDLASNLQQNSKSDHIRKIAETHARFEQIHPFSDGNGRTGRLIMLAQALSAGIAPPLVVKERKHAYYKYLEIAQEEVNYKPLELFVAQSVQFTHQLLTHIKK